jgi:hypothetical protein
MVRNVREPAGLVSGLRRTPRGWEEPPPPQRCPNDHLLRGGYRALIGSRQCSCGTVHRSFCCRQCDATVYDPEPGPRCQFTDFDGRADAAPALH